ncbi:MAG: pyridoxamine 5'-phosphate oxidase [Chitinophagaceae bacterium]|nr:pyridoxamine 5'-phosphate oxidase [Chitinophagaceae bacterium]
MLDLIADIRKDYKLKELSESIADKNAITQFEKWWHEATESKLDEVNAMTLATSSADGVPSARIVLLKGFDEKGFVFFTNYNSYKAQQLAENPRACLVFFWRELERQVRITGLVSKTDSITSEDYFNSRPEGSRISAIASPQSSVIESREWLEEKVEQAKNQNIKRPENWGGYILKPVTIEFWQGRASRLHDRLQYSVQPDGSWIIERLAP